VEPGEIEAIEERAEEVLGRVPRWIWDGSSVPVPVDSIADSVFSLLVREVEEMSAAPGCPELEPGQSISGLLLAGRGEIWVDAAEARQWPGRRRFTICHELGHWVLHRRGQQSLFCRRGSIEEAERADTRPPLPITEEEANSFAAAMLMPAELVRRHYRETGGDFERLCELFGASGAAMGRRLHAVI
jgi:hypothetical protein